MNTVELLEKITQLCKDAQEGQLDPEDLRSNMEDGWGGNGDDAFYGGFAEGKADLGSQIYNLLEDSPVED